MSFASHYHFLQSLRAPAVVAALVVGGSFAYLYTRLPQAAHRPGIEHASPAAVWPATPLETEVDWSQFIDSRGNASLGTPAFAEAFRFAGTFFISDHNGREVRKAVLGLVEEGRQIIAAEGDQIEDVTVSKIFQERIVLRRGTEVAELWLSFTPQSSTQSQSEGIAETTTPASVTSTSRFGESVGENSWVFKRESLLNYYNELLDAPEKLLEVFDSLKPLYNDSNKIEGYQLGIEGEREFFEAVGLREGDVIRKVNSLEMTNRNRAELFIRQVVQNKMSAIVIDIERDGEPKRLVYRVR